MRPPLRAVLVGCGHMGRHHARKLVENPEVDFLGVVDPSGGMLPELPQLAEVPAAADCVVVASPTSTHLEIALPLLERGLPCLVEKPLAMTREDAAQLAAFPHLSVNHIERFNPSLKALPAGLSPRYLKAERMSAFSGRCLDVDVVADLMIHDLDLALMLCEGEVTTLRAVGVQVMSDSVDIAEAWLEFSGGAVVNLAASRISPQGSRKLRLVGGGHYWSLDLGSSSARCVPWGRGRLEEQALELTPHDALEQVHEAFLRAVRGEGPWPVPGREALRAVELAEQVREQIHQRLERAG